MAFDWKIFAANFLETAAEGIEERGEEAKKYKEQQEAAAERSAALIQQRDMRAKQAAQIGRNALALGASQEHVRTAMASGITGVQDLYQKLSTAAQQQGVKKLGVDDIEVLINMPDIPMVDSSLVDMTLDDFAKRTYGAMPTRAAAVPQDDTSLVGKMFGFGAKDRVKQQLAETDYMDGMSIADINEMARQSEYQSLIPGSYMTFTDVDYFTSEDALKFNTSITEAMNDALDSEVAKADIKDLRFAGDIEGAKEKQLYYQQLAAKPLIEYYADTYQHGGFFDNPLAMKQIESLMGEAYLNDLRESYGVEAPDSGEASNSGGAEQDDKTKKPAVKAQTNLFEAGADPVEVDEEFPAAPPLNEEGKALVAEALSSRSIFRDDEDKYSDQYTKAQWQKMSRKERSERGLPESTLGGLNFYFRDDIDEFIEKPLKNLSIKRNLTEEAYKVKIKGRIGTYHVTKEQLEQLSDDSFGGADPVAEIIEYGDGEKKAKNITSNVLKTLM